MGGSPTQLRQPHLRFAAHRDINCLRTNLSPETGPISMGRRRLISERTNLRMGDVAKSERRLRTQTAHVRTLAPSGSVEPKHWHLARTRISTLQKAGPKYGASFWFGRLRLSARKVPQSTPNCSNDSDYRNNHRHQGVEPVRFSNGQQQTWTHHKRSYVALRSARQPKPPTRTHQIPKD
jgi:hypothetical protein